MREGLNPSIPYNVKNPNPQFLMPDIFNDFGSATRRLFPLSSSRPPIGVNKFISYTHSLLPWEDGNQDYISEGAVLFGFKQQNATQGPETGDVTLSTANNIIRQFHEQYHALLREDRDNEEKDFRDLLERFGEDVLFEYDYALKHNLQSFLNKDEDRRRFYKLSLQKELRYLTRFGILSQFEFLGVVLRGGDNSMVANPYSREYSARLTNIAFVPAKRARVSNVWGGKRDVTFGSKLYLVLTQVPHPTNSSIDKMYQIVPVATRKARLPLRYVKDSHRWFVGSVDRPTPVSPSPVFMDKGIANRDPAAASNALASLPFVHIQVAV